MSELAAYESLLRHFVANPRDGKEPTWLAQMRTDAMTSFEALGLPTTKQEDWRFTSLADLARLDLVEASEAPPVSADWVDATNKAVGAEQRLVFANGLLCPSLCAGETCPGVRVRSLREVIENEPERLEGCLGSCADVKSNALAALNTALFADGALVELERGAAAPEPIHLVFVQTGGDAHVAAHPRVLIVADEGSQATIVEHYVGETPHSGLTNPLTEIRAGRDAQINHVSLQERRQGSCHLATLYSRQESGSRVGSCSIAMGEGLSRLEIKSVLEGEGAHVDLLGLYLARERQHVDHHTTIDHASPRTTSSELYKGILDGRARGVFHGRVHVRPDAQKIDATQTNRTLLLSDNATIDSKPQLEIYADDVKCSHGATVGQLDEDQVFYLRSRGMGLEQARAVLTFAFASEVIDAMPLAPLRDYLKYAVLRWLPEGASA